MRKSRLIIRKFSPLNSYKNDFRPGIPSKMKSTACERIIVCNLATATTTTTATTYAYIFTHRLVSSSLDVRLKAAMILLPMIQRWSFFRALTREDTTLNSWRNDSFARSNTVFPLQYLSTTWIMIALIAWIGKTRIHRLDQWKPEWHSRAEKHLEKSRETRDNVTENTRC